MAMKTRSAVTDPHGVLARQRSPWRASVITGLCVKIAAPAPAAASARPRASASGLTWPPLAAYQPP